MEISPEKQNIDRVFSTTTYHIDFYQRDYRWGDEPVKRLLDDLFYKFNEQYERSNDLDPNQENIAGKYPWYYLNTYVTNTIDGRVYVVDGQQRLTTLSLILIKLRHMAVLMGSNLERWISSKIAGHSGYETMFWMNHIDHAETQRALFKNASMKEIPDKTGITAENMKGNYETIREYLDDSLPNKHKFETFVFYLLHRVVLINLAVEQTDVPMVFEVINDRGVQLRPYEILKGKLLGQIEKRELDMEGYRHLWENKAAEINFYNEHQFDEFFRFF